jgi:hypothetical protein
LFEAFHITTEFGKYCQVVGSLQHDSLRRVADIIEALPADAAYEAIKQRLLSSHQLTSYQRAEKLFAMPLLGARKPSELPRCWRSVRAARKSPSFSRACFSRGFRGRFGSC